MELAIDVKLGSEQSIMALQAAKAERYVDIVRAISTPVEDTPYPPDEADEVLQAIIKDYDEALFPELKLLGAEQLADSIIKMIKEKILDARGLRADATLDYRGEIFVLDINRRCQGCLSRPVVFAASHECVSCKLSDFSLF
ncbi:MAG TPA: hypothetical protein VF996_02140 [Candidatus Saccharimonadales bacterium]